MAAGGRKERDSGSIKLAQRVSGRSVAGKDLPVSASYREERSGGKKRK